MVHLKRLCIVLLAICMLGLAACDSGNAGNTEDPKSTEENGSTPAAGTGSGRYVETDITPPIEGRFTSFLTQEGTIICYDTGLMTRCESADGGATWSSTPGPGSKANLGTSIQTGTLLPDGRLLAYSETDGLITIDQDGSVEAFPIAEIDEALADGEGVMISLLQALDNERIALSYTIGGMMMQTRQSGPKTSESSISGGEPPIGAQESAEAKSGESSIDTGELPDDAQEGMEADSASGLSSGEKNERTEYQGSFSGSMTRKTLLIDLATGETIADLPVENASSASSDGQTLYLMNAAGDVTAYNLADGTPAVKPRVSFGGSQNADGRGNMMIADTSGSGVLSVGNEGSLYAAYDKNILRADTSGSVSTVLESTAYAFGSPRSRINSLFTLAGGEIVVNLQDNGLANRLCKYVWDENATTDPDKTLTIWSLEDNNLVRAAIAQLRKENPDARITYEVAMEGNNAVSAADAIKTLNTRLLSGSGPDVILLDGCPVDSYADKGMLLELGTLLDTSDIYENLLAPYASDGKLYCLPTQFLMPALMGSADALAQVGTLQELVALVVNGNDSTPQSPGMGISGMPEQERAALYFEDLRELCEILWLASASAIVSDNKLDTDALRDYLEAAKAISDKYALTETPDSQMGMSIGFFDGGMATEVPGSLVHYTTQMTNYGAFTAGDLQLLQMMMERDGSELMLFPGLTPGAWEPSAVVGISADTKVSGFAAEFLQTMLSLELQQLSYGTGMPVTRSGMSAQIGAIDERLAENDQGSFDLDVDTLIGQLKTPSMGDMALTDMMWSTVERCCKGEIDIEGAVKEIEQSVKNYLAERS